MWRKVASPRIASHSQMRKHSSVRKCSEIIPLVILNWQLENEYKENRIFIIELHFCVARSINYILWRRNRRKLFITIGVRAENALNYSFTFICLHAVWQQRYFGTSKETNRNWEWKTSVHVYPPPCVPRKNFLTFNTPSWFVNLLIDSQSYAVFIVWLREVLRNIPYEW